jgi:type IV fimbrial biogenesis protein FimT
MNTRSSSGFTLVELMVTIGVLAILLGLAAPSFTNVINSNRVTSSANELLSALTLTRSEAIKRGQFVTLCPANTAKTACVASKTWSNGDGWIAFTDNGPNAGKVDSGEIVLQAWPPTSGLKVTNVVEWVRYSPDGSRDGAVDPKFDLATKSATDPRCIVVSKPGRTALKKSVCS